MSSSSCSSNIRKSDWHCPDCGNLVFGSKKECSKCGKWRPKEHGVAAVSSVTFRPGDWVCRCSEINFGSRNVCRKCGTDRQIKAVANFTPDNVPEAIKSNECCICLSAPSTAIFAPCGHKCCCNQCASSLANQTCPMCRARFTSIVKQVYE